MPCQDPALLDSLHPTSLGLRKQTPLNQNTGVQGPHILPESLGGRRGCPDGCSFTGRSFRWATLCLAAAAGTRKAVPVRTRREVHQSGAGNFWSPSGFLRFSHLAGSRSPKRALGRGLRTAAAAEERQEPCADCAGAEGEHDAVGPSLESVPNALGGEERHKHRAGSIPEIQSSGLSGLL